MDNDILPHDFKETKIGQKNNYYPFLDSIRVRTASFIAVEEGRMHPAHLKILKRKLDLIQFSADLIDENLLKL